MPSRPKSKPVRSEPYRRLVASLGCAMCGVEGASQAAHPNAGKGLGIKASDLLCFPLCHVGANDHHGQWDRYETAPSGARERQAELEPYLAEQTQQTLWATPDGRRIMERLGFIPSDNA